MFTGMLTYKSARRGSKVIKVDRFFPSSQKCSKCGQINKAVRNLSIREWTCPACGIHHDRDINAAENIRDEALRLYRTI